MSVPSLLFAAPAPDQVTPGLIGFTVVALLGLATWFLLWSMNRHLRKVEAQKRAGQAPAGPPQPPAPRPRPDEHPRR